MTSCVTLLTQLLFLSRDLLLDGHEILTGIEAVASVLLDDFERNGTLEIVIVVRGDGEEVVSADVHHQELALRESKAVGAGFQIRVLDLYGQFGNEKSLIFFLNGGGVSAGIDQRDEKHLDSGEATTVRVAELTGRRRTGKEKVGR